MIKDTWAPKTALSCSTQTSPALPRPWTSLLPLPLSPPHTPSRMGVVGVGGVVGVVAVRKSCWKRSLPKISL